LAPVLTPTADIFGTRQIAHMPISTHSNHLRTLTPRWTGADQGRHAKSTDFDQQWGGEQNPMSRSVEKDRDRTAAQLEHTRRPGQVADCVGPDPVQSGQAEPKLIQPSQAKPS
jgi:hypothetical protein